MRGLGEVLASFTGASQDIARQGCGARRSINARTRQRKRSLFLQPLRSGRVSVVVSPATVGKPIPGSRGRVSGVAVGTEVFSATSRDHFVLGLD
jgi:hypothetical protein